MEGYTPHHHCDSYVELLQPGSSKGTSFNRYIQVKIEKKTLSYNVLDFPNNAEYNNCNYSCQNQYYNQDKLPNFQGQLANDVMLGTVAIIRSRIVVTYFPLWTQTNGTLIHICLTIRTLPWGWTVACVIEVKADRSTSIVTCILCSVFAWKWNTTNIYT